MNVLQHLKRRIEILTIFNPVGLRLANQKGKRSGGGGWTIREMTLGNGLTAYAEFS